MVVILATFAPTVLRPRLGQGSTPGHRAILATGRRTVSAVLRIVGLSHERHFTNYHRVLNRDVWSCLAAGRLRLGLIVAVISKGWAVAGRHPFESRSG